MENDTPTTTTSRPLSKLIKELAEQFLRALSYSSHIRASFRKHRLQVANWTL
ncbi:hypothetical protein [Laspinema olomoucense]|uniref:Uncharacterized protein n=1 Tax=Laspinema olomoucense D3b TaxID=2953688 RepID=A0ABT2N1X8_9CYAN|nr:MULTISPECIES: hypothetical protein [unclassified Laspinema]MCT7972842.1 hypothetical protein [Laspinema sp. D3d]MCT7976683.1 hypothetical protein [Laspinema sp. D3b]MCT7991760.1 hypothetical protein [Laspinema sp. D3a]